MKRKLLLMLCISLVAFLQAFAQNKTITGTVTSKADGLPIPGATIKIKGYYSANCVNNQVFGKGCNDFINGFYVMRFGSTVGCNAFWLDPWFMAVRD